jgi:hypothetical protein
MGENADTISKHIKAYAHVDGIVTGDETRLRQVITNLARCPTSFVIIVCSLTQVPFQQRL